MCDSQVCDAMIREAANAKGNLKTKDLEAFITVDKVAREIEAGDHIEYWKSAPYILNFMDNYVLKNKVKQHIDTANGRLADILQDNKNTLLNWREVQRYALSSYEAERKMIGGEAKYHYNEMAERRISLLQFSDKEGRLTGMPLMAIIYPCLTLASEVDVLAIVRELIKENKLPFVEEVEARVADKIRDLLVQCLAVESDTQGRGDESWYWASMALLDRHFQKDAVSSWLTETPDKYSWYNMVKSRSEGEGSTGVNRSESRITWIFS